MKNTKLRSTGILTILMISTVAFAACDPQAKVTPPASPSPAASPASSASPIASPSGSPAAVSPNSKADALAGKWTGLENSSLNVTKKGDKYSIEIANHDGPQTFEGMAKGDVIEFTRKGKMETIKAATGAETGMKGFEKETNCVVVTKGSEGYCKK